MDLRTIKLTLEELAEEKGIAPEKIIETIEMALAAAYKRDYGKRSQVIRASFNIENGDISFRQVKTVVDESVLKAEDEEDDGTLDADERASERKRSYDDVVETITAEGEEIKKVRFNPDRHMMIEEARDIKKDVALGEELEFPLEIHQDYGRIAAQTAKQVIIQRIREAEREAVWSEFKGKEGDVISGIVQRIEGRNVFLDLGRATGLLPYEEQIPHERYRIGERIKALLLETQRETRGPGIYLSRSHPRFVMKLFEIEVPEIAQGVVEVRGITREAGSRTKIGVHSIEDGIDPVGSLVGQKGVRVGTVISELGGEKIDIIEWSENPERYIGNALSPAKVLAVDVNEEKREATVFVDESQLSLAIGRAGQNVRLAAKLTGWRIDVKAKHTGATEYSSSEEESEEPEPTEKESETVAEETKEKEL